MKQEPTAISLRGNLRHLCRRGCQWLTHRKPKEEMKPPSDKDEAIKATAQFYKDLDTKKGYVHAFEAVRNNPHRQIPKPNPEKMAELRRKALNSF